MNEPTLRFIENNLHKDIFSLSLLSEKYPEVDMQLAIRQILGKQKVRTKIPTFYKCKNLLYPVKLSLEQSSSEITAKHKLQSCEGKVMADLTGGFGVDSFFFSENFQKVIYVEKQSELCELARHNFKELGKQNIEVKNSTAEDFLEETKRLDWIFLDPARRNESGKKVVFLSDCEPNVTTLSTILLSKANNVMIKLSPMIDISNLIRELPYIYEIQIVAVDNECKEVLAMIKKEASISIQIKTRNYSKSGKIEQFDFFQIDEINAEAHYTNAVRKYLYEPNAALMKSGAFKLISQKLHMSKLQINSHLYTSDDLVEHFPGRIFEIEEIFDFSKRSLKLLTENTHKANISVRNFPINVNELRKKLKISEGGDIYLFATTLSDQKKIIIKTKKR